MMEYQSHVESTFIHTRAICSYIWPLFLHMQSLSVHYFPLLFPMFTGEPSSFHLSPLLFQICPYETTINFPHEMDLSIMFHHVSIICFSLLSLLFTIVPHFSTWKSSSLLMFSYVFHMKSHHYPSFSHHFPIVFHRFSPGCHEGFRPFKDLANVHDATAQIERVLGAVERYAAELPEAAWWRHGESLVIIIEQWF